MKFDDNIKDDPGSILFDLREVFTEDKWLCVLCCKKLTQLRLNIQFRQKLLEFKVKSQKKKKS